MNTALPNEKMKANRYAILANAKKKVAWIKDMLAKGHTVAITNHMRSVRYPAKHAEMFVATKSGAYFKSGNKMVCIDYNKVSAF